MEQLRNVAVESYQHIEDRMDEGTRNRTVAATQMNATSSRAHTIVGITFTQKSVNEAGQGMAKVAVVNLVDLAGRWVEDRSKSIILTQKVNSKNVNVREFLWGFVNR